MREFAIRPPGQTVGDDSVGPIESIELATCNDVRIVFAVAVPSDDGRADPSLRKRLPRSETPAATADALRTFRGETHESSRVEVR